MVFKPDFSSELILANEEYKSYLFELFSLLLKSDAYESNSSNDFVLKQGSSATISSKSAGVFCCLDELKFLAAFANVEFVALVEDGASFDSGIDLVLLKGDAGAILSVERVLLNVMTRCFGIAVTAHKFSSQVKNVDVAMTRKAMLGMLDKKAASYGGVLTHRLSLSDAIMFKDNYYYLANLEDIVVSERVRFVEVEVDSIERLEKCLAYYRGVDLGVPKIVMLDNFSPEEIQAILKKYNFAGLTLEVSGGVHLKNLSDYDIEGVDYVSTSQIANSYQTVDLSLNFDKK
jgi:nicotinate-nucleotide pyrophosphorylase (carboxylating)